MQSQRTVIRLGAGLAIVGAILAMIGNSLHPHLTDPTLKAFLSLVASRSDWPLLHLTIMLAIFCIVGALFGVLRSIENEPAAGLARLGFVVAVAGSAMVAVDTTSDGLAMKRVADLWAAANPADQAVMLPSLEVLRQQNFAFYTTWIFLFLGLPFVLYGSALIQSDAYPQWVGWLGLISGAGSTLIGMMQFVGGETELLTTLFIVFSVAITIWVFIIGVLMWRRTADTVTAYQTSAASDLQ
jgi:hypothetical protein